ncbi:MAG TPA: class F sortase [Amycolatopsis sp.]|uniref:class F sortase n=1 Tax=Amycolatopsis sp. TaxID=37632 RepID=UPI002B498FF0|nr:class F sortase [Amycolatopsis sp.]HKS47938.1 class F sortase [Amycolatopsis sp.]
MRGIPRLLAALLALVLLVGCSAKPAQVVPPPAGGSTRTTGPERAEHATVDIPKIDARSSLVSLSLNPDQTVEVPPVSAPMQAGWYSYGPAPGEPGPAVILGHVDGDHQKGIFFRLKELVPGDQVSVSRKDGSTVRFVVTKVDQVGKDSFPTEGVYGDTAGPELRLITCGGSFDRAAHSYRDNIIVYAALR